MKAHFLQLTPLPHPSTTHTPHPHFSFFFLLFFDKYQGKKSKLPSERPALLLLPRSPEAILTTQRHAEDNGGTDGGRVPIKSRSYRKSVFVSGPV